MNSCTNCGKDTSNTNFCSRQCVYDYRRVERRCKNCDKVVKERRKYCNECSDYNPNVTDWANITLQKIRAKRPYQKHSRIRNLARRKYLTSSKPKYCIKCGYSKNFDVCHVKAIHEFSGSSLVSQINSLHNLIALCKNCHWELDNGHLAYVEGIFTEIDLPVSGIQNTCVDCEEDILDSSKRCRSCAAKHASPTKIDWPNNDDLARLVWEIPVARLAEKFGVSDNAIRKRCISRGIETPGRGYWAKRKSKL